MSLIRCATRSCPHWTREGYGDNPHMEADGVFCWRCRQRHRRDEEKALRALRKAEHRDA